jgi:hypothetical protein
MIKTPKFAGLTLVDATEPLSTTSARRDVSRSVAGDSERCVLALGFQRVAGVERVYVERTRMIVVFRDDPTVGVRYMLDATTRTAVQQFDDTPDGVHKLAAWIAGRVITGYPPSPANRLGYKRGQSGSNRRSGTRSRAAVYDRANQTRTVLRGDAS